MKSCCLFFVTPPPSPGLLRLDVNQIVGINPCLRLILVGPQSIATRRHSRGILLDLADLPSASSHMFGRRAHRQGHEALKYMKRWLAVRCHVSR